MAKQVRGFIKYSKYYFTDQDPAVGLAWSIMRQQGLTNSKLSKKSTVPAGTTRNWWTKKVKRPQLATLAATYAALGLDNIPITAEGRAKMKAKFGGNGG